VYYNLLLVHEKYQNIYYSPRGGVSTYVQTILKRTNIETMLQ